MTSWIRSSLRRKGQVFAYQDRDNGSEFSGRVIAETFDRHWQQLRGIAAHNVRRLKFQHKAHWFLKLVFTRRSLLWNLQ